MHVGDKPIASTRVVIIERYLAAHHPAIGGETLTKILVVPSLAEAFDIDGIFRTYFDGHVLFEG